MEAVKALLLDLSRVTPIELSSPAGTSPNFSNLWAVPRPILVKENPLQALANVNILESVRGQGRPVSLTLVPTNENCEGQEVSENC